MDQAEDSRLARVDHLISEYAKARDAGDELCVICQLYYVLIDYLTPPHPVLHALAKQSGRDPACQEAMGALHQCVVNHMCRSFGCHPSRLVNELELYFGRQLDFTGIRTDQILNRTLYLKHPATVPYRVYFKDGMAWQFPWWMPSGGVHPMFVRADTRHASNPQAFLNTGADRRDWSGFIMDLEGGILIAKHKREGPNGQRQDVYHSTYRSGGTVMAAGTILIIGGHVLGIAPDSGHYRPPLESLVKPLELFQFHGLHMLKIVVQNHLGVEMCMAPEFLRTRGNWDAMVQLRRSNVTHLSRRHGDSLDFDDTVESYWKKCLRSGKVSDTEPGRRIFSTSIFPNMLEVREMQNKDRITLPFDAANSGYILAALNRALRRNPNNKKDIIFRLWTNFLKERDISAADSTLRRNFLRGIRVASHPGLAGIGQEQLHSLLKSAFEDYHLPWE